ncbi:MAG: hypothetical protein VCF24_04250 [Candidatus Latescibacterota bacterium]
MRRGGLASTRAKVESLEGDAGSNGGIRVAVQVIEKGDGDSGIFDACHQTCEDVDNIEMGTGPLRITKRCQEWWNGKLLGQE